MRIDDRERTLSAAGVFFDPRTRKAVSVPAGFKKLFDITGEQRREE
jgi:hypothetical protein